MMEKKSKKFDKSTLKRILSYIFKYYKWRFIFVIFLVIVSAITGVVSSLFIQKLIDNYITPMLGIDNPDFLPLVRILCVMAGIYMAGVVSAYVYQRMMSRIAQRCIKSNS